MELKKAAEYQLKRKERSFCKLIKTISDTAELYYNTSLKIIKFKITEKIFMDNTNRVLSASKK